MTNSWGPGAERWHKAPAEKGRAEPGAVYRGAVARAAQTWLLGRDTRPFRQHLIHHHIKESCCQVVNVGGLGRKSTFHGEAMLHLTLRGCGQGGQVSLSRLGHGLAPKRRFPISPRCNGMAFLRKTEPLFRAAHTARAGKRRTSARIPDVHSLAQPAKATRRDTLSERCMAHSDTRNVSRKKSTASDGVDAIDRRRLEIRRKSFQLPCSHEFH